MRVLFGLVCDCTVGLMLVSRSFYQVVVHVRVSWLGWGVFLRVWSSIDSFRYNVRCRKNGGWVGREGQKLVRVFW